MHQPLSISTSSGQLPSASGVFGVSPKRRMSGASAEALMRAARLAAFIALCISVSCARITFGFSSAKCCRAVLLAPLLLWMRSTVISPFSFERT